MPSKLNLLSTMIIIGDMCNDIFLEDDQDILDIIEIGFFPENVRSSYIRDKEHLYFFQIIGLLNILGVGQKIHISISQVFTFFIKKTIVKISVFLTLIFGYNVFFFYFL